MAYSSGFRLEAILKRTGDPKTLENHDRETAEGAAAGRSSRLWTDTVLRRFQDRFLATLVATLGAGLTGVACEDTGAQHAVLDITATEQGDAGSRPVFSGDLPSGSSLDEVGNKPSDSAGQPLSAGGIPLAWYPDAGAPQGEGDAGGDAGEAFDAVPEAVCGDGEVSGNEDCDPGDFEPIDCVTLGYTTGSVGCTDDCRYDFLECAGVEDCFDNRDNDGDGFADCDDLDCEAACTSNCEVVPEAEAPFVLTVDNSQRAAELDSACIPGKAGPAIVYKVVAQSDGMLEASALADDHPDMVISIRTSCDDDASELACSNLRTSVQAEAGQEFFVVAQGVSQYDQGRFELVVETREANVCGDFAWDPEEECDDALFADGDGCDSSCKVESTELFFNDGPFWPDPYPVEGPYYGRISPADDVDFVSVNVPEDDAYVIISTYSLAAGSCEAGMHDPYLTLLAPDRATEVASNDDYDGTCSRLVAEHLDAGEYVVGVSTSPNSIAPRKEFPYELAVTVDWCGNGVWGPLEECDDGNTESDDGCSDSCRKERTLSL
jgi:cysteine-rich repeat protein